MRRSTLAAVSALAVAACSHARNTQQQEGGAGSSSPAEQPAAKGAPAAPGRPPVPAAPEQLLADGAVPRVQQALEARGYLRDHRTGRIDAATSAAIARFQRDERLAATGFPDRETISRLGLDPEKVYVRAGRGEVTR